LWHSQLSVVFETPVWGEGSLTRKEFRNRKSYWKSQFRGLDRKVMELLKRERRGDIIEIPISTFIDIGHRTKELGERGEAMLDLGTNIGASKLILRDLRDCVNMLEMFSSRLKLLAESKWNDDLPNFPMFKTTVMPTANLMQGVKRLDDILGGPK